MTNSYTRGQQWGTRLRRLGLAALLLGGATVAAQAQNLNYTIGTSANVAGTYTDLAANGTAIATANTDDANSAVQDIGFTFRYGTTNFTQFTLNTNGFIKLGATAPSDTKLFLSETDAGQIDVFQSPLDPNVIAVFNADLTAGAAGGTEYRVATTGTAPNRVCTIQWKNVSDKAGTAATQYTNLNLQIRLYETTSVIELVYGTATAAPATASALRFMQAGVKGTDLSSGQGIQPTKQSSAAWSTAIFSDFAAVLATQTLNTVNYRSVAPPDAGRTFRFTPAPANDAAVAVIYTLGKLATPLSLPHAVQAVVTNTGSAALTAIPVTLNVTGANTFTDTKNIASLPVGASATVTFANYPSTLNVGRNNVVVSIAADGNTANNQQTYGQDITTNRLTYFDQTGTTVGPIGATGGVFATKFTVANPTVVSDVALTFAAATGNTAAYQVLLYDVNASGLPGNVLYTSATQNRTAAGGVTTVSVPSIAVPASFFVALKQTTATSVGIAYQTESPIRGNTFFLSLTSGATWIDFLQATPPARVAIEVGTTVPNCAAPTAVSVSSITPTSASVAFTLPAGGSGNYQIIYGPTGFDPGSAGTTVPATTSPVVLTGLTPGTVYQVYVRSVCTAGGNSALTTAVTFATSCDPNLVVSTFPYSQNFDTVLPGQSLPCGISILNANGDAATWAINRTAPFSGTNAMRYTSAINNSVAANDWFFTPPFTTAANTRYQVAFRYRGEGIVNSPSSYTEKLEVKVGPAATVAGQTTTLYTNTAITNTSYALANATSTPAVAVFTPGAGTQYVGFHVYSDATQGNLYIDDLSITASVITATSSEALLRAVTVFPNPSATGLFDLEIHGAKAKGSLAVLVTNALGQQVYTGAARDNYTNRLDLSSLAPGLYHLQVRNGDETMTRQLAIVK